MSEGLIGKRIRQYGLAFRKHGTIFINGVLNKEFAKKGKAWAEYFKLSMKDPIAGLNANAADALQRKYFHAPLLWHGSSPLWYIYINLTWIYISKFY